MASRNGKIANLPNDIRELLNLRLLEGEIGKELVAWLNALPAVQSILASQFNASPISEVNLTLWRQGGYLQWLTERECFYSARALAEGDGHLAETGLSAERLLNILTLRLGQLLMRWDFSPDESVSDAAAFSEVARKARILQGISRSVLAIHRAQSPSARKKSDIAISSASSRPEAGRVSPSGPVTVDENSESHDGGKEAPAPQSQLKNAICGQPSLPEDGLVVSKKKGEPAPKILSGPIPPLNLSQTPFKPDLDLREMLNAV